jgi:uncharacterized protein
VSWQFVLTGLLIGTLVGLTGMGGGSLMTPILVIVFGFKPTLAVGTDIAHGAIFKTIGALRHRRLGTVHQQLSGWMFLGSGPASIGGVVLGTHLKHQQALMGYVLGAALLFGACGLVAKSLVPSKAIGDVFEMARRDRIAAVAIGLVGGFIVGLTSVGSGVFFALTLLFVFPLRSHKVVGTDVFHAAALLWVAGAGHLVAGNVDMHAVGWLLIGSIPGVLVGSHLTVRLSERGLRLILASLLGISGLKLIGGGRGNTLVAVAALTVVLAIIVGAFRSRRRGDGNEVEWRRPGDVQSDA